MSRKDRSRTRRRWGCKNPAGCGAFFDAAVNLAAVARVPAANAAAGTFDDKPTTLICPLCNTFHFLADDRRGVRLLTPAERFELYTDVPGAATAAETRPPVVPGLAELHVVRVEG